MATSPANTRLPSTTWTWKKVKLSPAPQGESSRRQASSSRPTVSRWDRRDKITLTVVYTGGAESWWVVQARGQTFRFPGHLALEDVMRRVLGEA